MPVILYFYGFTDFKEILNSCFFNIMIKQCHILFFAVAETLGGGG